MGGEAARLRPRLIIETFKRWTARELDLRREGASASELAENMTAEPAYLVPAIDWQRTTGKVLTDRRTDTVGFIAAEMDALLGWSGGGMSSLYARKASRVKLAEAALERLGEL